MVNFYSVLKLLFALLFAGVLSEPPETEITKLELVPAGVALFLLIVKVKINNS